MHDPRIRWKVAVPIHRADNEHDRGWHLFTGPATDRTAAIEAAHTAVGAVRDGLAQDKTWHGWTALGLRDGWVLEWPRATAGPWRLPVTYTEPYSDE